MKKDELSKKCKKFEKHFNGKTFIPGMPLMARLDGRSFHTFTKGLKRPFDERMIECMKNTTQFLIKEFKADLAYTQSDEITLFWNTREESEIFFNGKMFKLNSVMAAACSVFFYKELLKHLPEKSDKVPVFDCRTWQVPSYTEVSDVFVWRQLDAVRNSINSLAQSVFSHKELQHKSKKTVLAMLDERKIIWEDLPVGWQRGFYYHKISVEEVLDFTNRLDVPETERVMRDVIRRKITELDVPILSEDSDFIEILLKDKFNNETP